MPAKIRHNGEEREFEHKLVPERFYQGAEIFTYDPVGNRLTGPKDKLNYTYNQGNQLTELIKQKKEDEERKTEYQYDRSGNLTKKIEYDDEGNIKKITLYTYDFENRLTRIEMQRDAREKK